MCTCRTFLKEFMVVMYVCSQSNVQGAAITKCSTNPGRTRKSISLDSMTQFWYCKVGDNKMFTSTLKFCMVTPKYCCDYNQVCMGFWLYNAHCLKVNVLY